MAKGANTSHQISGDRNDPPRALVQLARLLARLAAQEHGAMTSEVPAAAGSPQPREPRR